MRYKINKEKSIGYDAFSMSMILVKNWHFSNGFKGAYEILANDVEKEYEKRIFFLTDAMPN